MEIGQLAAFWAVARTGSVTRAAGQLHSVQSSVTAQIQALKAELGVPLFDRPGRRIVLTDAGRWLLPYAERVLDTVAEAREMITSSARPRGTVRLSGPESLCGHQLPTVLQRCRQEYPEIRLVFQPTVLERAPLQHPPG